MLERLNDVDVGVRQDASGCASLLFYHYTSASHEKIFKHVCENLPPLPLKASVAAAAYDPFPDQGSQDGGGNMHEVDSGGGDGDGDGGVAVEGHKHFLAPCYQAFLGRGGAAVHCRESLEATSLACRAALAVAATRAVDALNNTTTAAIAPSASADAAPNATTGAGSRQVKSSIIADSSDGSPLPPVALKCCADLVAIVASRPDLRASVGRALTQLATGLG